MEPEAPTRTGWDVLDAGRGLGRLLTFNPKWAEPFDFSLGGFLRSFYGPLMALPFYLFHVAMLQATQTGKPVTPLLIGVAAGEHVADVLGYVLIVFLIARPLGIAAGVTAYVTVLNWRSLYLTAALAAASLLLLGGPDGLELLKLPYLVLLFVSLFLVWRAARETLTQDVSPIVLLVVLLVGWSALMDQGADWVLARLGGA